MIKNINHQQMVIDALCKTLQSDQNPQIRAKAAKSLGQLAYQDAIPALCNAWLQDEDVNVRFLAVKVFFGES
jgi:HEAT repeat protein